MERNGGGGNGHLDDLVDDDDEMEMAEFYGPGGPGGGGGSQSVDCEASPPSLQVRLPHPPPYRKFSFLPCLY